MNMEMRDGFAPIGPIVNNDTESLVQILRTSDLVRNQKKMTDRFRICFLGICDPRDRFFRDNQSMNGSLRIDVPDSDAYFVLVQNFGRNFPGDDFLKDRTHFSFTIVGEFQDKYQDYLEDKILSEDNQKFSKATSSLRFTSISPAFFSKFEIILASLMPFLSME